jgi:hypothetical protein
MAKNQYVEKTYIQKVKKNINIIINLDYNENYINIDLENQLLIPEPNIIEKERYFSN